MNFSGLLKTLTKVAVCLVLPAAVLSARPSLAEVGVPVEELASQMKGETSVPILLPSGLPMSAENQVYVHSSVSPNGYQVSFEFAPNCNGSTACFIGSFSADRNGQFQSGEGSKQHGKVQLANGTTGWFTNSCGATCTALLQWSYQDVLYEVTIKNGQVEDLVQIANSAILGGDR